MTAKEALAEVWKIAYEALEELEAIKSVDGGEALEELNMIRDYYDEDGEDEQTCDSWKIIENYILKAQAQEKELAELKKSDENKEQSSIDYYNEMKKYKQELLELKKKDNVKKPKMIHHLGAGLYSIVCSNCNKYSTLDSNEHKYCQFCGQKIA